MRILLDENIPIQLKSVLTGHEVTSVNDTALGWKNITNGRLLSEMEGRFDILVTADRSIYSQNDLSGRPVSILVLPTNRRREVLSIGKRIADILGTISICEYVVLERDGAITRQPLA